MLEELRQELHVLIENEIDLSKLSSPEIVAKSQELDLEVNKYMHRRCVINASN